MDLKEKKFLTATRSTEYTLYCNQYAYMYMYVSETKVLHSNIYPHHLGCSVIFNLLSFSPLHIGYDSPNAV